MIKVFGIGNLTKDVELQKTTSGLEYCRIDIAVNRDYENSDGVKKADFFTLICWKGLAQTCSKYLAKGRKIGFTGNLQTRTYNDKNDNKRTVTEIICDKVEFLTPVQPKEENAKLEEKTEDLPF